ncbi:hypothetical protein ACFHYO_13050 [Paracoccus panacisoli]|uniref:Secreted protein n=1 Tax=Paracoccus panacisoli TaxID=1510163 RepID=A0ABV6T715_9RHOB
MTPGPTLLALTIALLAGLSGTPVAAAPQAAVCEVTLGGARIDGPCRFTPRKGGSFDIRMDDGRRFGGAESLSLDVTGKGRGRLSGSDGRAWGTAARQADGACWAATGLTVCVRDPGDAPGACARGGTPPTEAERRTAFGARCHMGGCTWVIQSAARQIGEGSAAIPGRRVEVTARAASAEYPDDYPAHPEAGLEWSAPFTDQYFCSSRRPAFADADGSWQVLDLPQVFGASEAVSLRYLKACHPGTGDDPYAAAEALDLAPSPDAGRRFPDFAALIAR